MTTVNEILKALEDLAPSERKMDFDNVGLLVGRSSDSVNTVLVALDITDKVIAEAKEESANLIVTHHPVIFNPVKDITDEKPGGRHLLSLIENRMSVISMHTNLDAADRGVNDALATTVGLRDITLLCVDGKDSSGNPYSCGRIGETERSMTLQEFLPFLQTALNADGLRYCDAGRPVRRVAVVGGSGGSYLNAALDAGCDTFVTADVKYDVFLSALESGINMIDADHFCTENVVVPMLADYLTGRFPQTSFIVSRRHGQTARTWKEQY